MKKILLFLICCSILSCKKEYTVERSFCYWKTTYWNDSIDQRTADSLGVKHIYLRLFDVGWNPYAKSAAPMATLWDFSDDANQMQVTPCIYITNDAMQQSTRPQLKKLAEDVRQRMNTILQGTRERTARYTAYKKVSDSVYKGDMDSLERYERTMFDNRIKEILIDCDWTQASRDNYFYFLSELKKEIPAYKVAATIRLWQYRDHEKAGVPPVDNGLLMCYNMESPTDHKNKNSIGSPKILKQYVNHDDYPLKLNVALPIFNWSLVFRGGQFLGILANSNMIDMNGKRFKKIDENRYVFTRDEVIGETFYRNGDEVRVEKVSDAEMREMISILKDHIDLENSKVTFFSWDENFIKDYGIKNISGYYSLFGS